MAGGIAERLGLDPLVLRVAFVVLALASGGAGVLAYLAAWLVLPAGPGGQAAVERARLDRDDVGRAVSVGLIVVGVLLLLRETRLWFSDALVWPVLLAAVGLTVMWSQADGGDRMTSLRAGPLGPGARLGAERLTLLRIAAGAGLVVGGVGLFLATHHAFQAVPQALLATAGIVGGLALIFAPWWWRLGKDLAAERRERIRSQERAELAAHLHDSVLQTLALIQRQAGDARSVVGLARRQERELRSWLYGAPGWDPGARLEAALERVAAEVEERHGVPVEVVTVGDCPLDDHLGGLVEAAREALVNAAKWSEAESVSLYAEVEPERVSLFVRDRGTGFDPGAVPADRRGIVESIVGRMARHGGQASIRSTPGEGSEIELILPREER